MNYSRMTYLADGAQTSFRYAFKVDLETDLRVFTVDPLDLETLPLYLATDYTVTGIGDPTGGTIELTAAGLKKAVEGVKLVIKKGAAYECLCHGSQPTPGGLDFSYQEQWTGGWDTTESDGLKRKIYVKTLDFGPLPLNTVKLVPFNVPNLRKVLHIFGGAEWPQGAQHFHPLPYVTPYEAFRNLGLTFEYTTNSVYIRSTNDASSLFGRVTVYYTKNE